MEKFKIFVRNRNEYFLGFNSALKPEFAVTNYWKIGASFHLGAADKTLVYQLQPPHVGVLDDWMLTISILSCRLTADGMVIGNFPVIAQSKRYMPFQREGVRGWVTYETKDNFNESESLSKEWDDRFMEHLFPKKE